MTHRTDCPTCYGSGGGTEPSTRCHDCNGTGILTTRAAAEAVSTEDRVRWGYRDKPLQEWTRAECIHWLEDHGITNRLVEPLQTWSDDDLRELVDQSEPSPQK